MLAGWCSCDTAMVICGAFGGVSVLGGTAFCGGAPGNGAPPKAPFYAVAVWAGHTNFAVKV